MPPRVICRGAKSLFEALDISFRVNRIEEGEKETAFRSVDGIEGGRGNTCIPRNRFNRSYSVPLLCKQATSAGRNAQTRGGRSGAPSGRVIVAFSGLSHENNQL